MSNYHIPVMPSEVIDYLNVQKDKWYVDCNLGGGGHADLILKAGGKVLGIDLDPEAISEVTKNHQLEISQKRLILYQRNFSEVGEIVEGFFTSHLFEPEPQSRRPELSCRRLKEGEISRFSRDDKQVAGVLFDLGVSTHQLLEADRGFSFNTDAPLDMRMDQTNNQPTAADLINGLTESELAKLFWKLGEERFSKAIAKKIVEARQKEKIETTNQLANIILSVRRRSGKDRTHPATRVFQALRIAVNDELNSLRVALPEALEVLAEGGNLVVLTFHSLEDRIVKNFMRDEGKKGSTNIITHKPVTPSDVEIRENPRSRSGKLRAAKKQIFR